MLSKGLQELRLAPSVYLLWQFKLLAAQIIDKPPNNRHHFTDIKPTLIECEKVMSIKRQLKILLSTWERGMNKYVILCFEIFFQLNLLLCKFKIIFYYHISPNIVRKYK